MSKPDLTFKDLILFIKNNLCNEEWIDVYRDLNFEFESILFYCALLPNKQVEKSLTEWGWDLHFGHGRPGIEYLFGEKKTTWKYYRFGGNEPVEPLIVFRDFFGLKPEIIDISEEFVQYFNLYHDKARNVYIFIDDNGDEEDVIQVHSEQISIKLKYIKIYLHIKKMSLAIFFDFMRFSDARLEDIGISDYNAVTKENDYIYIMYNKNLEMVYKNRLSVSCINGKKIIRGLKSYNPDLASEDKFVDFIIGINNEGEEVSFTCDRRLLSNYFGANPGNPHDLTPVVFRREVLSKYYSQPGKYTVKDGILSCGSLWSLRLDNNLPDTVIVYLCDLGLLSYKEQLYWRSYNIAQSGILSSTAFGRDMLNEFAEPITFEHLFKNEYEKLQKDWERKYGWRLHRQPSEGDDYIFNLLHIPLSNEQAEFDNQVLTLTKLMIDLLNEKEIGKHISEKREGMKGIDKLEVYIKENFIEYERIKEIIEVMRGLQELRSVCVAHAKGKDYKRVIQRYDIDNDNLTTAFNYILMDCLNIIRLLYGCFINL
jgi:hypothetical protein